MRILIWVLYVLALLGWLAVVIGVAMQALLKPDRKG